MLNNFLLKEYWINTVLKTYMFTFLAEIYLGQLILNYFLTWRWQLNAILKQLFLKNKILGMIPINLKDKQELSFT